MQRRALVVIAVFLLGGIAFGIDLLNRFDQKTIGFRNTKEGSIQMVAIARDKVTTSTNKYEALWQLGVAYYYLGEYHETDNNKKKEYFLKAKEACEQALALKPSGIDALYWYGVSYGLWGAANGILESLFGADDILNAMNKVIEQDPSYFLGLPWAVRAKIYYYVPGFLFGNKEQAFKELKMAIKYGAGLRMNYQYAAELLIGDGRWAEANEMVKKGISIPFDNTIALEERVSLNLLSNYLKTIQQNLK